MVAQKTNRSPEPSQSLDKKYRLHLYNGEITEWFPKSELTWMIRKHEGRTITIEVEYAS